MNDRDDELTPELRDALRSLPRERDPGRLLEERTVRSLRERGMITAPAPGGQIRRIPRAWLGGAVAAGIALFAGGLATGQWMGARAATEAVQAVRAQNAPQAALAVQETGTAYVQAMARFAELSNAAAAPQQSAQGREVAVRMMRAAADELLRIAPDDPIAAAVLAAFQRADSAQAQVARPDEKQRMVWF